jgi:hypothetical protein
VNAAAIAANERSGKAVTADRMAAIIACSWPRAELTALAHHHKPRTKDALARSIAACTTNQERARLAADALHSGGASALDFTGASTTLTAFAPVPTFGRGGSSLPSARAFCPARVRFQIGC